MNKVIETRSLSNIMANGKKSKNQKKRNGVAGPAGSGGGGGGGRRRRGFGPLNPLDAAALSYARLLTDPCGAPLVKGISGGTNGAIAVRLEADAISGAVATFTAGAVLWVPSLGRAFALSAVDDLTGVTFSATTGVAAGAGFLATNASSYRCVAGCVQLMYPGSESSRSGVVSMGLVPVSAVSQFLPTAVGGQAGNTNVAALRQACQLSQRTPLGVMETKFRPGQDDGDLQDLPALNQAPAQSLTSVRGCNAILATWAGLPAAVGMRVRSVAAYEYEPNANNGMVASVETPNTRNTANDVLRYLDYTVPGWWQTAGGVALRGLRAAASYYTGGASEGLIAAMRPTQRSTPMIAYNA